MTPPAGSTVPESPSAGITVVVGTKLPPASQRPITVVIPSFAAAQEQQPPAFAVNPSQQERMTINGVTAAAVAPSPTTNETGEDTIPQPPLVPTPPPSTSATTMDTDDSTTTAPTVTAAVEEEEEPSFKGVDGIPSKQAVIDESGQSEVVFKFRAALPVELCAQKRKECRASPTIENRILTNWVEDQRGYRWRLMYYPYGNHEVDACSVYLELDPENKEHGKDYCRRYVKYTMKAKKFPPPPSTSSSATPSKAATSILAMTAAGGKGDYSEQFEFTQKATDWGYNNFAFFAHLQDRHWYKDGHILVEVSIQDLPGFLKAADYNCRRETGMVGLKNQGATCYMNSLLQFLWSVRSLRKAVYDMPTQKEARDSVAVGVQRVFYRLQTNERAVNTKELTKAFGWDVYETFQQHDIQELNRVLCDKMEEKMKGTPSDGTLKHLFEGKTQTMTRCLNVDFKSQREETFYDVQLDVKGCVDLDASFRAYIRPETMDGENKYEAEGFGKQDAERFTAFSEFPPVMTVHLKRFEYDIQSGNMVKINQRFEFTDSINLASYMTEETRPASDGSLVYRLHSVLVHSGDVHAGHYYAYIKHSYQVTEGDWYKFDDETVIKVDKAEVLEDSYGTQPLASTHGTDGLYTSSRSSKPLLTKFTSSAYMLVYVKETELPRIMRPITDGDIATHLNERFNKEKEDAERKSKEQREGHLYIHVEAITEADVKSFTRYKEVHDRDVVDFAFVRDKIVGPDKEPDPNALPVFKVRKLEPIAALMLQVREKFGIPLHRQRLWSVICRHNKTNRVGQFVYWGPPDTAKEKEKDAFALRMQARLLVADQPLFTGKMAHVYVEDVDKAIEVRPRSVATAAAEGGEKTSGEDAMIVDQPPAQEEEREEEGAEEKENGSSKKRVNASSPAKEPEAKRSRREEGNGGLNHQEMVQAAAAAGEAVKDVKDLIAYLEKYAPREAPPDSAFVFFKGYRRDVAPGESSLTFLYALHIPLAFTVREMLSEAVQRCDWLAAALAENKRVELYDEVVPTKLLSQTPVMDKALKDAEIMTGDIFCMQVADPVQEEEEDYYNKAVAPRHVNDYFRYLIYRRIVHLRPYSAADEALLQKCAAEITSKGLEVPGKVYVVRDKAGQANELALELSREWSYERCQKMVGRFLGEDLEDAGCLRFYGREQYDDGPSKTSTPTLEQLTTKEGGPLRLAYPVHNNPWTPSVLYFEVLSFPIKDLHQRVVRDIVINDARLRRAAAVSLGHDPPVIYEGDEEETSAMESKVAEEGGGQANGNGSCKSLMPVTVGRKRAVGCPIPAVWTQWAGKEPMVLSMLLPKDGLVKDLLEAIPLAMGGQSIAHMECELLKVQEGDVQGVWAPGRRVIDLPESTVMSNSRVVLAASGHLVRHCAILHVVDPIEREMDPHYKKGKKQAAASKEFEGGKADEEKMQVGGEEGMDDDAVIEKKNGEEEAATSMMEKAESAGRGEGVIVSIRPNREVSSKVNFRFVPLHVTFLGLGADHPKPEEGGESKRLPFQAINSPVGLPVLTCVTAQDTSDSFLERIAAKVGEPVETLRRWYPVIEIGDVLYAFPGDEGPIPVDEEEVLPTSSSSKTTIAGGGGGGGLVPELPPPQEGQAGEAACGTRFFRALTAIDKDAIAPFADFNRFDIEQAGNTGVDKLIKVMFLNAEAIGCLRPEARDSVRPRKPRRADQGIKIRDA